jgi:glycosyltransferase involved in cell wall biosynthesis
MNHVPLGIPSSNQRERRVLLLNYEFPPLGGGAGNATRELLKRFAQDSELKVDVVTSSMVGYRKELFSDRVTIHFLDIGKKGNVHYQSNKNLLMYAWKAFWYCKTLKKEKRFDLIHAFFGIPCGYVAMKLGLPYIVSLRGSDVPFYNKRFFLLDVFIFKHLSRKIWRNAKAVIANSEGLKELAQKTAPRQIISVIPNGVDIDFFRPASEKISSASLRLVSVGRLIERKGYGYLVMALKGLCGVELVLVGDGPLRSDLERMARDHGVRVDLVGALEHNEVVRHLQRADIFVLPSLNEGMSNAVLEAMACGLPIIATDTGGSKELIDGNGFIVEKANSNALREAIDRFLSDRALVARMGARSRELAEGMSWRSVAGEYKKLYETD